MNNYAFLYTSLLLTPLLTHQHYVQNTPVPTNALPIASPLSSDIPLLSFYLTSLLLSQLLALSNTSVETKSINVYVPRLLHICLSQNNIAQIFHIIVTLCVPLLPQQVFSSYTSDTIPNDTSLHKQRGLYFLI